MGKPSYLNCLVAVSRPRDDTGPAVDRYLLRDGTPMPVKRVFWAQTELNAIPTIGDSLGTHLAAKLQAFGSDERTLTDELCDMLCVWTEQLPAAHATGALGRRGVPAGLPGPLPRERVQLRIEKVSQRRESVLGADLELRLGSPVGTKRMLAQAKVLDPDDRTLRCDTPAEWEKLRVQLENCRTHAGHLSFLLVYVPMEGLRRVPGYFATWEQNHVASGSGPHSRFGATLIPVDDLLDRHGAWISGRLPRVLQGRLSPPGLSLTRVLLEMLACLRGRWERDFTDSERQTLFTAEGPDDSFAYRSVAIGIGEVEEARWEALSGAIREATEAFGREESGDRRDDGRFR